MNLILFDDAGTRQRLLPFTHTRPVADIRCGILTMRERWGMKLGVPSSTLTEVYLQAVFPLKTEEEGNLYINGAVFADEALMEAINALPEAAKLIQGDTVLAAKCNQTKANEALSNLFHCCKPVAYSGGVQLLQNPWDIFSMNDAALRADFALLTAGRTSQALPENIHASDVENIFLEEGAVINAGCVLNARTGPIYIGKDAELMEGSILRGPVAVCEHAIVKMGAKIYGATTIGPGCRAGGEISNAVFFANSNKGHDGFIGNAVIGEWCNLGADTNCSNLKNNYDTVKVWSEEQQVLVSTGLTFCGLLMGDHSKCGINTMFNTGTVVGVSANIFGGGFPDKFVPSFTWGGTDSAETYQLDKAMETAGRMMARRNAGLGTEALNMYQYIFTHTAAQRNN